MTIYKTQLESDGTWTAIMIQDDGVPLILEDGFASQDEAEEFCAEYQTC